MSPEQALGRKLDHRSDVFSLGSCLYEMLTRIPPFTATNEMDLLIKVRDAKYRPVSELQPGIPPELEAICDKCLTRSRANRYQTAAEAEGDLRAFLRKFMPNYSRSHLGRFIRKMFAQEIERELRQLEEFVMADEPSDDVGENLIGRDADFDAPEVPFQPKPTSVSVAPAPAARSTQSGIARANDFASNSNFTTMPKMDRQESSDIHQQPTMILDSRRGRRASQAPPIPPGARRRSAPPSQSPPTQVGKKSAPRPIYDEELHAAPTMIIDIGRIRQRGRRG
jgi:serine/threonine-protein kinase